MIEDAAAPEERETPETTLTHLAQIKYTKDGVHINNDTEEGLWLIVKSNENMYRLSPNDMVKFGRVEYHIREIKTCENQEDDTDAEFEIEDIPEEREEEPRLACRICLADTVEYNNPLISPCYCSGTMKYIHVGCLQQWMESRVVLSETSYSKTFFWKNYDCELCKFKFPLEIAY